jgi:hypothetical protein
MAPEVDRASSAWRQVLTSHETSAVGAILDTAGIAVEQCIAEARQISEAEPTRQRLQSIKAAVTAARADLPSGAFERFVLGHAVLGSLAHLQTAPVSPAVKRLTLTALVRLAERGPSVDATHPRFIAFCKIATLRRFPAGQFDWELSGLPRSWLPLVRPVAAAARLMGLVAGRWRGFGPAFFIHMPVTHRVHALLEREALKAYHRMAHSMALQPAVKGLIASSWLHSPDTFAVSPHLSWLNRVFLENGAVVATMGRAPADCGVLKRSLERQQAFAEGRFVPTLGLVVWPRREMLAWAASHPELES